MKPRQPQSPTFRTAEPSQVFGRQPVLEVLRARRRRLMRLMIQDTLRQSPELEDIQGGARAAGVEMVSTDRHNLDRLTQGGHHQGVLLEAGPYPYVELDVAMRTVSGRKQQLWIALDHLMDPHNLGALLRTADAVGACGVLIPADRAVHVTDTVVRTSAGASEHVTVCRVTNLVRAMQTLQKENVWFYGLEALPEAKLYTAEKFDGAVGLVLGGEGEGLGRLVRETCDFLIRIPLLGKVQSLNVSVAGAVAMYEVVRQQSARAAGASA
ncbi:MAG: 23S rRNA (guanosine(2251)-2'-O)-methyltransferase RlmB [Lentisphaerae bacterium]|nr:23S rRNA (guanosine(2251)-2'-O)-methyltransferase RlmB [Lentisphaerota bacterium]